MSCSIHARVFLVALCLLSVSIVLESLLARDLSRQFTSCAFHRSSPPQRINTSQSAILFDAPIETDNYTSVLLRAILDSPHSWELIVKGVLHSLTLWAVVGVTTLFHHVDQPDPGLPTIYQPLSCFATQVSSGPSLILPIGCVLLSGMDGCSYIYMRTRRAACTGYFHAHAGRSTTAARHGLIRELVSSE
ncbi:hypothetical protein J3R82DRAFT_1899 [Butyriboletus roseoflavus]|nr:hypothetical protein J3R82DRAFT_1899 [Butyriboletus roseoflavus]